MPIQFIMKRFVVVILFIACLLNSISAQDLPEQMFADPLSHIIYTGQPQNSGLYNDSKLREFRLYFSQPDFWTQLKNNKQSGKNIPALLIVDGDSFPNVGVRFKGNTSYSMVKNSEKFSFNITMDDSNPNQELKGYSTINLNNCFEDPSMMREFVYLHQIRQHVPAAKACYVKLFINDVSWGIYPNVQQINKTFAKEWWFNNNGIMWRADVPPGGAGGPGGGGGGWGDGTAGLNYLGADTSLYKKYYTLKYSEQSTPWNKLLTVCDILNNTPLTELESKIKSVLDLDRTLWFLASEIAFSDDDSYVYKGKMDYYLYYDQVTGRVTPQEFDGNSALSSRATTWSPFYNAEKVNYPLLNKLLQVPSIRQRYIAHMKTLVRDEMDTASFNTLIRKTDAFIGTEVLADTKKLYTNAQYQSEKNVLMNFIQQHKNTILSNSEFTYEAPKITEPASYFEGTQWKTPLPGRDVFITTRVSHPSGINAVRLYFSNGLTGPFTSINMLDDGLHHDGGPKDGLYGININSGTAGSFLLWYVEAEAANNTKTLSYAPEGAEHNVFYLQVSPEQAAVPTVTINELQASNTKTVTDEAGEYDDWVELYNTTKSEIDLSGAFLTDDPSNISKWSFPSESKILPGEYLIVWCDENKMQGKYHTNFKLSAEGESVWLIRKDSVLMDSVTFGQQTADLAFARVPNGTGSFRIQKPTFSKNNELTAITDISDNPSTVFIYPNPVQDLVMFRPVNPDPDVVRIFDLTGRKIYESQIKGAFVVDCTAWLPVTYVWQLGLNKGKIIKW